MATKLPSLPTPGDLIGGRFRIQDTLGSGGFGTVYRAIQENIGREVALKFLSPKIARDPVNIERFRREAYHVSQLRHPNTITLYDYGQTEDGLFYMVMEVLKGISLSDAIQRDGAIEEGRAAHIFLQVLRSLTEAHQRGIVHRDMKPENIHLCEMFGEQDYVKVLDFGVAKMTMIDGQSSEDKLTDGGRIFGTPMYMSPEQARAEAITLATDVYSLGLLIFEMFTGLPPVTGRNRMDVIRKQISEEVPQLTQSLEGTPLGDVIRTATKKDPKERYSDATEMQRAFYAAIRQMGISPAPSTSTSPEVPGTNPNLHAGPPPATARTRVPSDALESPPLPPDAAKKPVRPVAPSGVYEPLGDLDDERTVISAPHPDIIALDSGRITFGALEREELPLIGRELDIERISELVAQSVHASSGHLVLLEGEGGVGKTRVVRELRERLLTQHIGMATGTFRPSGVALDTLREALADYWWVRDADLETADRVIRADLGALGVKRDDIDFLVRFVRPGKNARDRDSTKETQALYAKLERTLLMLGELRPFVLVLEDMQHADTAT
ncbi:MAG: protein kinase, partial [Myxococcota bacterium]